MNKTVASVIDDINEWENPRGGSVFYVTAVFTDESVGSVGRKDHDAALEVQGLLRESIGRELDFTLEAAGQTKTGREKFKIKGFGTPGGAATYTAPGGGAPGPTAAGSYGATPRSRPPEHDVEASIRAAVALKAAVTACPGEGGELNVTGLLVIADIFDAWLAKKASEPASSAYGDISGDDSQSTPSQQAGVGSETTSPDTAKASGPQPSTGDTQSAVSAADGGQVDDGEASASPPDHIHDYQLRQGVRGFLVCDGCGATRKKETATK